MAKECTNNANNDCSLPDFHTDTQEDGFSYWINIQRVSISSLTSVFSGETTSLLIGV